MAGQPGPRHRHLGAGRSPHAARARRLPDHPRLSHSARHPHRPPAVRELPTRPAARALMRVVTLLPAATEIVAALGGADRLVGISHECDYPASVLGLPRVTATPIDPSLPSARIDAEVRRLRTSGRPVIGIDADALRGWRPTSSSPRRSARCARWPTARSIAWPPLSTGPRSCSGSAARRWTASGRTSGRWAPRSTSDRRRTQLVAGLQARLAALQRRAPRRRLGCCASSGWTRCTWPAIGFRSWSRRPAEAIAGAAPGSHSARREWDEVAGLQPDLIVVMLCGFGVERSLRGARGDRSRGPGGARHGPGLDPGRQRLHVAAGTPPGGGRGADRGGASRRGNARTGPLADAASLRD